MFTWLNRFQPFGALVMRLVLGAIVVAYGYQKLVPHGALNNFIHMVGHLGWPRWLGYVAAFTEFFGGILLIAGLLTRTVAVLVLIDMCFAISSLHGGLTGPSSFSLPLACLGLAVMLVTTGAGPLALDNLTGKGRRRRKS